MRITTISCCQIDRGFQDSAGSLMKASEDCSGSCMDQLISLFGAPSWLERVVLGCQ